MTTLSAYFGDIEYQAIRRASQFGKLPRALCAQLEAVIDFGATTARDVFNIPLAA